MRIYSKGDTLIAFPYNGTGRIEWVKGTHTALIMDNVGRGYDVFTFAWEKNKTSMLDFTSALQNHLDYMEA